MVMAYHWNKLMTLFAGINCFCQLLLSSGTCTRAYTWHIHVHVLSLIIISYAVKVLKVVLQSVDETLVCDHSNKSSTVIPCQTSTRTYMYSS